MFDLINKYLAKGEHYHPDSWIGSDYRIALVRTQKILMELLVCNLLPLDKTKDGLALWLLEESPLTEREKNEVRLFLFTVDYY